MPPTGDNATNRKAAAEASRNGEQARIIKASADWAAVNSTEASVRRFFVVSMAQPWKITPLFDAISNDEIRTRSIHIWLGPDESLFPLTSQVAFSDFSAMAVAKQISLDQAATAFYETYFERRLASLKRRSETLESDDKESLNSQISEITAARDRVRRDGIMFYGFECDCTASQLTRVIVKNGMKTKAVEPDGKSPPIAPWDRLRDKVIDSGGRFGRQ